MFSKGQKKTQNLKIGKKWLRAIRAICSVGLQQSTFEFNSCRGVFRRLG